MNKIDEFINFVDTYKNRYVRLIENRIDMSLQEDNFEEAVFLMEKLEEKENLTNHTDNSNKQFGNIPSFDWGQSQNLYNQSMGFDSNDPGGMRKALHNQTADFDQISAIMNKRNNQNYLDQNKAINQGFVNTAKAMGQMRNAYNQGSQGNNTQTQPSQQTIANKKQRNPNFFASAMQLANNPQYQQANNTDKSSMILGKQLNAIEQSTDNIERGIDEIQNDMEGLKKQESKLFNYIYKKSKLTEVYQKNDVGFLDELFKKCKEVKDLKVGYSATHLREKFKDNFIIFRHLSNRKDDFDLIQSGKFEAGKRETTKEEIGFFGFIDEIPKEPDIWNLSNVEDYHSNSQNKIFFHDPDEDYGSYNPYEIFGNYEYTIKIPNDRIIFLDLIKFAECEKCKQLQVKHNLPELNSKNHLDPKIRQLWISAQLKELCLPYKEEYAELNQKEYNDRARRYLTRDFVNKIDGVSDHSTMNDDGHEINIFPIAYSKMKLISIGPSRLESNKQTHEDFENLHNEKLENDKGYKKSIDEYIQKRKDYDQYFLDRMKRKPDLGPEPKKPKFKYESPKSKIKYYYNDESEQLEETEALKSTLLLRMR